MGSVSMRKAPADIMSMSTSQKRESGFCSRVAAIMLDERLAMVGNRLPLEKSSAIQPTCQIVVPQRF